MSTWSLGTSLAALPGSSSVANGPGADPAGDLGALGAKVELDASAQARLTGAGQQPEGWPRPRERAPTSSQQLPSARWSTSTESNAPTDVAAGPAVGTWLECSELDLRLALQPEALADLARLYEHRLVAHWPASDAGPGPTWFGLRLAADGCPSLGLWLGQAVEWAARAPTCGIDAVATTPSGVAPGAELRFVEFSFNLPSVFEPGQRYTLELWRLGRDGRLERVTQQPLRIVDIWAWDLDPLPGARPLEEDSAAPAEPSSVESESNPGATAGSIGHPRAEPFPSSAAEQHPTAAHSLGNPSSGRPHWQARALGQLPTGPAAPGLPAPLEFVLRLRLAGLTPLARFEARLWLQNPQTDAPNPGPRWPAGAVRVRTPGGPEEEDLGQAFGPATGGGDELQAALVLRGNSAGHAWLELHGDLAWARWPCRLLVWVEPEDAEN